MKVSWTRPAYDQLAEILQYLSERDRQAAGRLVVDIDRRLEQLGKHPNLGRVGRISGTRELVLTRSPYLLAYRVTDRVEILALMHGAREWPETL